MIDKEDILERTGRGLAVFKHYINFPVRPGKNFRNPLYEDRIASCNIYYDRHAQVFKMKDFGNNEYSGDCFWHALRIGREKRLCRYHQPYCIGPEHHHSPHRKQRYACS